MGEMPYDFRQLNVGSRRGGKGGGRGGGGGLLATLATNAHEEKMAGIYHQQDQENMALHHTLSTQMSSHKAKLDRKAGRAAVVNEITTAAGYGKYAPGSAIKTQGGATFRTPRASGSKPAARKPSTTTPANRTFNSRNPHPNNPWNKGTHPNEFRGYNKATPSQRAASTRQFKRTFPPKAGR